MTAAALQSERPASRIGTEQIGRLAIHSLYQELALHPKPGLVSPQDNGSHADMSMATFFRSLFTLRHYFQAVAAAGRRGAEFSVLQALGVQAEARMLQATGGVNTHRGAIFNLGLLCAAAGELTGAEIRPSAEQVCQHVARRWGDAIRDAAGRAGAASHGDAVRSRYGAGGAREEAASGFPSVWRLALPALRRARLATADRRRAALQALFTLIAEIEDSNLLWRGGSDGLAFARLQARKFMAAGGTLAHAWHPSATRIHAEFVARNLSPGGSADLLAATLFADSVQFRLAASA